MTLSNSMVPGQKSPAALPSLLQPRLAAAPDTLFLDLLGRYRSHGGLASSTGVALLLSRCLAESETVLSGWIRNGDVVSSAWRGAAWLPMFQLQVVGEGPLRPRADVQGVAAELRRVCDELDLCGWFVKPNGWLDGRPPVAVIDRDLESVRAAARADRFVLGG